jgi:hypothetical protein
MLSHHFALDFLLQIQFFIEKIDIIHLITWCGMPNFNVLLEGAWLVRDVKTEDDAIGVAISEAGKRLKQRKMDIVPI